MDPDIGPNPVSELTILLRQWRGGDQEALSRLAPLVYGELKRRARCYLRGRPNDQIGEANSLVNEVWLRLLDGQQIEWQDRMHFFAVSAQMMRRILVDAARARSAAKRGGSTRKLTVEQGMELERARSWELVALDDALTALERIDPRKVRVIELRFFGGLSVEETARALAISAPTVKRDWKVARAWIERQIRRGSIA